MPSVRSKDHEPVESLLRRFKRAVEKAGTLTLVRRRRRHEQRSKKLKRERDAAVKRSHKRQMRDVLARDRSRHS